MFQTRTNPSLPVDTICFPSGENFTHSIVAEWPLFSLMHYPFEKSQTLTIPSEPPVTKCRPSGEAAIEKSSSLSCGEEEELRTPSGWVLFMSQKVIWRSWPTETIFEESEGLRQKELIPPILWVWLLVLFSFLRSQPRIDLSLAEEMRWMSSGRISTLVTLLVCSFRWEINSRVQISQIRTSPSKPPVDRNLKLKERSIAETPFLCALSIVQSGSCVSTLYALTLPSDHPEMIISSVKTVQVGCPAEVALHRA